MLEMLNDFLVGIAIVYAMFLVMRHLSKNNRSNVFRKSPNTITHRTRDPC